MKTSIGCNHYPKTPIPSKSRSFLKGHTDCTISLQLQTNETFVNASASRLQAEVLEKRGIILKSDDF